MNDLFVNKYIYYKYYKLKVNIFDIIKNICFNIIVDINALWLNKRIVKYHINILIIHIMKNLINKINAFWEKQVFSPKIRKKVIGGAYLIWMCFIGITSVSLISVNASQNIDNSIKKIENVNFEKEVKKTNTWHPQIEKIISDEAVIKSKEKTSAKVEKKSLIISDEAIISDFLATNDLWKTSSLEFFSIWQWTLIKWKADSNSVVLVTTAWWTECIAQTNGSWKFGCMFANESVWTDDLQLMYK